MKFLREELVVTCAVVCMLSTIEGLHIPQLFLTNRSKNEKPSDTFKVYKKTVVHSASGKWVSNPVFEGRPRWNPVLSKLIKRYLSSQTKEQHSAKRNDFNFFVKSFNALNKRHKIGAKSLGIQKLYFQPRAPLMESSSMKDRMNSRKSLSAIMAGRSSKIRQLHPLIRHRRDIPAFGVTAGDEHEVIDPFDATNYLLKWEHGKVGIGHNQGRGRYSDMTAGLYSPLYHNNFNHRPSVVGTSSVGYSGDFFGDDITSGWYRKKRSLNDVDNRQKRGVYDKVFSDYGMDSFPRTSGMKDSFDSFSDSMKRMYGNHENGLLYPADPSTFQPAHSFRKSHTPRRYTKPRGKYFDFSDYSDYNFGNNQRQRKTNFNSQPNFQYSNIRDPVVSASVYGAYPDTKHGDYYKPDYYDLSKLRNTDRVLDTNYDNLNFLPVGRTGYVPNAAPSSSATSSNAAALPAPVPVEPAVEPKVAASRPVITMAPAQARTNKPIMTTQASRGAPTTPFIPNTTPVTGFAQTTLYRKLSCCENCNDGDKYASRKPCYPHGSSASVVTTTPCYDKHRSTPQVTPHVYVNYGHKHKYQTTTTKSIWSEFEIIGNMDSWFKTNKPPRNPYLEMLANHHSKYLEDDLYYGRTTPIPLASTDRTPTVSRIVTQAPGAYQHHVMQGINLKIQKHDEEGLRPRVTGTVEMKHNDGQKPRFIVKLPFAAGKLPLSIRKLIISRFTPSPVMNSEKSATVNRNEDCAPWNTTCMQEYVNKHNTGGHIDVIAQVDPTMLNEHFNELRRNHIDDLSDEEEKRKAQEAEFLDYSPELLPELDSGEIQSSVPVHSNFLNTKNWSQQQGTEHRDQDHLKKLHKEYREQWMSPTTASLEQVKLDSLPAETPKWLRNIIEQFIKKPNGDISNELRPMAMMQVGPNSSGQSIHWSSCLPLLFVTFCISMCCL